MKITAHTLVKNEENFVWYAINSVIDYVDEIFVWDNGSSDKTVEAVQSIKSPKIKFRYFAGSASLARQKMLSETNADWLFILDGDEIWHGGAVADLRSKIYDLGDKKDVVVIPNYMLVGDIFHYQENIAGRYSIAGRVGHYNIRAIRITPGLHIEGIYPNEAYVTKKGVKVQDLDKERILFLDKPYLHASFLKKIKYEFGIPFPLDFYYPEVFFKLRPTIIPSPWKSMGFGYKFRAFFETPLRLIYRRILLK